MGIIFQRTCFSAPATLSHASEDTRSCGSGPPAQEMLQKRQEFDELLSLARVTAYLSVLDPALFTPDQELIATVQTLTECLFPPSFDSRKIGRISRKIAENFLVRGIRNHTRCISSSIITDELLIQYSENCRIPMWVVEELGYYCPGLTGKIDRARCWADLYTVSKECTAPTWFKRYLRVSQISQAYIDLGLPSQFVLTAHNAVELEKYALNLDSVSSRVPLGTEPKTMLPDLITVRVDYRNTAVPDVLAYCHAWKGLISLTPNFFQDSTLLVSCPIVPRVTKITDLVTVSRVTTFMHEIYHVGTVLSAKDGSLVRG